MSLRLKNKVALITGAAVGIGKSHAELFAKEGAIVIVTTRSKIEKGKKLVEKIIKNGGKAVFYKLDVTCEADWVKVMNEVVVRYGKLNILVNNAGVSLAKNIEETSLKEWNSLMCINSTGVFLGSKYAIEVMKVNDELCSIINISSIDSIVGEAELPAYCASKGAVTSLTK
jgi:3(or 17)beta-hydroxysteroid dehydrogenase